MDGDKKLPSLTTRLYFLRYNGVFDEYDCAMKLAWGQSSWKVFCAIRIGLH